MTTTEAEERLSAIARARAAADPAQIVAGVKTIVGNEVRQLSPDARVVETSFFNHTYMPDFVLEWTDHGRATHRPLFIRNHITEATAPREVAALGDREPVLLGLDPVEERGTQRAIRRSVGPARRMLVSDIASLGALGAETAVKDVAPLVTLVRANMLRGGRGLLAEEDVETLVETADLDPESEDADERLEAFNALAADLFEEAAATRLHRAADILRLALTSGDEGPILAAIGGELNASDLGVLLPYLLSRQGDIVNSQFWAYIGSLMDLPRLEELSPALGDVSVEPLVSANLRAWGAKRAQVSLNADFDEAEDDGRTSSWTFTAGLLTGIVGPYRVTVASDARRLKGREGSLVPAWKDIQALIDQYVLDQVDLRGVVRRIRLSAEESGDVARDIRRVTESLTDSYSVHHLAVRRRGTDSDSALWVDFAGSTVTAEAATSVLDELIEAALRYLTFRRPLDEERLGALLGRSANAS